MFRRRWSGLPKDPIFSSNLTDLGYFVNNEDEIRNIDDPDYYFKYFLSKNGRVNDRQRFHFNEAIRDIVHGRLEKEGLTKLLLPKGTPSTSPHVPIFTSANLAQSTRVVVIFGEPCQDLGNLALRVANGPGGINKGTMVSVVQDLRRQISSASARDRDGDGDRGSENNPPGIILANTGELWWWPEGRKTLSPTSKLAVPMKSMVHLGRAENPKLHSIPKNEDAMEHVRHVLDEVVAEIDDNVRFDIIGIGISADYVTKALDTPSTWAKLGHRINTLSLLGSSTNINELSHEPFKAFLPRRARAYIMDDAPALTALAQPGGNPNNASFTKHGCTVYSSGEDKYVECILITCRVGILSWLQEVALAGPDYSHPGIVAVDPPVPTAEEWAAIISSNDEVWKNMPEFAKPSVGYAVPPELQEQRAALESLQEYAEDHAAKQGKDDKDSKDDDDE